MQPIEKAL